MPALAPPIPTRLRLLEGAAEVFARKGLHGATTREIAQAAGVNEVTLFRLFQNKQRLLAAVIEHVFTADAPVAPVQGVPTLREIFQRHGETYGRRLQQNVALMRVLVGEIQHCDEQEVRVVREVFRPQREELIAALRKAQARGEMRAEAEAPLIADQFGGMIFTGVLRSSLPLPREYSPQHYLAECVETMVRALQPGVSGRKAKR